MIRFAVEGDTFLLRDDSGEIRLTPFDTAFLGALAHGGEKSLLDRLRALHGPKKGSRIFASARERLIRFAPQAAALAAPAERRLPPPQPTPLPTVATLFLTWRCEAGCRFCDFAPFRSRPVRELDAGEWRALIRELAAAGCREVGLTGGEPTLHPAFGEIARSVKDAGCRLVVQTRNADAAEILEKVRPHAVMVGLDALSPRTAEFLYGNARLPSGLLELLARMRAAGARTIVSVVVSEANRAELPALFSELASRGVRSVILGPDRTSATTSPEHELRRLLSLARRAGLPAVMKAGPPPSPENCASCNVGRGRCILSPRGEMLTCDQPSMVRLGGAGRFNIRNWKALRSAVADRLARAAGLATP